MSPCSKWPFNQEKEEIADFFKITHFSPPKKSKNSFIFATIARQNVQSIFQCNTDLCNTNAEVVRLKQMLFINFVAYLQSIVERHKT